MPSIQIVIDSYNFRIDSADPETIRRWLGETVAKIGPRSYVTFQIYPLMERDGTLDWPVADSRFISRRYDLSMLGIEQFVADMKEALSNG